ncbi:MAG: RNA polymerase sigma-70 factor [Muribaculaceae bacterium]|nr:RNA polymerase sigma-70 factor [Muribaculaceae bacterium]
MTNIDPAKQFVEQKRLAAGKIDALRYFYEAYAGRVRAFAYKLTGDMPQAEDITHNVFIRLWEQHEQLMHVSSIEAYLYRMTRNAILNHMKHMEVERDYLNTLDTNGVSDEDDASELADRLAVAIDSMPARQRRVFLMSRFDRMTYAEISEQLGISPKTVHYHISEALSSLRKALMAFLI